MFIEKEELMYLDENWTLTEGQDFKRVSRLLTWATVFLFHD